MIGMNHEDSPSPKEVQDQLGLLLQSNEFSSSERLKDFLTYIVDETLAGRGKRIKAYNIGVEVFRLGKNFDAALNSTIRVHAVRLRAKLEQYYSSNHNDKVRIDIPKGSYLPTFTYISKSASAQKLNDPTLNPEDERQQTYDGDPNALSVLVMPFSGIPANPSLFSFLQGLTKALVMYLNRFGELKLFTTSADPAEDVDIYAEAKKVGARFVLSGSVHQDGKDLRLHMSLVDALTHGYIWTDKFDGQLGDPPFELQDSFASRIVARIADSFGSINRTLFEEQLKKPLKDLDIQESMLYYHNWAASLNLQSFAKIKTILEQSIKQNPYSATLKAMLSDMYNTHYKWGLSIFGEDLDLALKLAKEALDLDNRCRYAHWAMAYNCFLRGDKEGFVEFSRWALELNPHDTNILASIGVNMVMVGNTDEGMEMLGSALRLNPHVPRWHRIASFVVHYLNGEYELALSCAKHITPNNDFWTHLMRAAVYGQLRDFPTAKKEVKELLSLWPAFKEHNYLILPRFFFREGTVKKIMEGLELAGLNHID